MKRSYSDTEVDDDNEAYAAEENIKYTYSWIDNAKPCCGFTSDVKEYLLSLDDIHPSQVLQFTLDFVFGWYSPWVAAWRGCRGLDRDERATMLEFVTEWLALVDVDTYCISIYAR